MKIYEQKEYVPVASTNDSIDSIIDFSNEKYRDECIGSLMKHTPSRKSMSTNRELKSGQSFTPTVTTKQDRLPNTGSVYFKNEVSGYLDYRFITPRESYLLMGFTDSDFSKVKSVFGVTKKVIGMDDFELAKWKQKNLNDQKTCSKIDEMKNQILTIDEVNYKDKLYRQAGNSISIQVLELILFEMFKESDE